MWKGIIKYTIWQVFRFSSSCEITSKPFVSNGYVNKLLRRTKEMKQKKLKLILLSHIGTFANTTWFIYLSVPFLHFNVSQKSVAESQNICAFSQRPQVVFIFTLSLSVSFFKWSKKIIFPLSRPRICQVFILLLA